MNPLTSSLASTGIDLALAKNKVIQYVKQHKSKSPESGRRQDKQIMVMSFEIVKRRKVFCFN